MTKKRIGTVLAIAALLVISYFIPVFMITVEDNSLQKEAKAYEIENMTITSGTDIFAEEMENFPEILTQDMMYVKSGKNLTIEQVQEIESEFIKLLSDVFYTTTFSQKDPSLLKYHEANVYLTTSVDLESVYYIWNVFFVDAVGREYSLYIDDTTGKVLGFACPEPQYFLQDDTETKEVCTNLMEYYGYQGYEFQYPEKSGESCMIFFDEEGNTSMVVPVFFNNTYDGSRIEFNLVDNYFSMDVKSNVSISETKTRVFSD